MGTFLVVQQLRFRLPVQGVRVRSLVVELFGIARTWLEKQYWNKSNKDFKKKHRERHYQKWKLQANIFHKYRCKNSQLNIRKPNPTTHKRIIYHDQIWFTPVSQSCFNICKSINMIHPINKGKTQNKWSSQ